MTSQEKRLKEIIQILEQKNQLTTREIMKEFGISFDTARRDIIRLTDTGRAIRFHGGLMKVEHDNVPGFSARRQIQSPLKKQLAKLALDFIHPNGCYFVSSSTTLLQFCQLCHGMNITIVTNSIDNAVQMLTSDYPQVVLLGGLLNKENHYTYSPETIKQLDNYNFDMALFGTSRLTNQGAFVVNETDAATNRKAAQQAQSRLLVAEKHKFAAVNSSPYRILKPDQIDILITDQPVNEDYQSWFASQLTIRYPERND